MAFSLYFEQKLVQLLGYAEKILHPFGGMADSGTRVDLNGELEPDFVADAHDLPFEDETFDLVILDPPYSDDEAQELYGAPKLSPANTRARRQAGDAALRNRGWRAGDGRTEMRHGDNPTHVEGVTDDYALALVYADLYAYADFEAAVCSECPDCAGCSGACADGLWECHVPCFCAKRKRMGDDGKNKPG